MDDLILGFIDGSIKAQKPTVKGNTIAVESITTNDFYKPITTEGETDMRKIHKILEERGATYGDFRTGAKLAQNLKEVVRGHLYWLTFEPYKRESIETMMSKISRLVNGDSDHIDSWEDISGYSELSVRDIQRDNVTGVPDND